MDYESKTFESNSQPSDQLVFKSLIVLTILVVILSATVFYLYSEVNQLTVEHAKFRDQIELQKN